MRLRNKLLFATIAVAMTGAFCVAPALAELGDVLHTIPCAGANTADLAWVEGTLYQVIFAPTEERNIYQLDPATGAVLAVIPYAGGSPQGLAYDGEYLWQSDLSGDAIIKMDATTGAVIAEYPAPGDDPQALGLGWDGASLWLADSRGPEKIWELDALCNPIGYYDAPGTSPYGLACGAGYIWVSDNNMSGGALIYQIDPDDGAIVDSFVCPDGGGSPNGIAHDGEFLWIAVNTNDTIYQVDDGLGVTVVHGVTWSRLKSLF